MSGAEGRKRQRAVMATDSDWETVRERADAAGMDVSRFVVERLTAPAAVSDALRRRQLIDTREPVLQEYDGWLFPYTCSHFLVVLHACIRYGDAP